MQSKQYYLATTLAVGFFVAMYVGYMNYTGLEEGKGTKLVFNLRSRLEGQDDRYEDPETGCNHKQAERKATIESVCRNLDRPQKVSKGFQMVIDEEHKVLYCHIPKAGCTTLLSLMEAATATGEKEHLNKSSLVHVPSYIKRMGLTRLDSYPDATQAEMLAKYTKIVVVRHPISRLISAYWDKMTMLSDKSTYFSSMRESVLRRERPNATKAEIRNSWPTFREFVRERLSRTWKSRNDRHWKEMYQLCSPCAVQYDYVLKLESLQDDIQLFIKSLVTPRTPHEFLEGLANVKRNTNRHTETSKAVKSPAVELGNLTFTEKYGILKFYKRDMDIFGYEIDSDDVLYTKDLTEC